MSTKPKAIFFDWDGTLVNTLPGLQRAHNHVRNSFGHPDWTEEEFYSNLRFSSLELYPRIYGENSAEALRVLYDFIEKNHLTYLEALPGAPEIVALLRTRGTPFGIVSNKRDYILKREIEHMGWGDAVVASVGAGVAKRDKPAGDPILYALDIAGINISDIWFVGDTITDLEAAADAGCPCVLITHGRDLADLIEKFAPIHVVPDCAALNKLFESL